MNVFRFFTIVASCVAACGTLACCDRGGPEQSVVNSEKVNFFHYFSGSLSGGIDDMVAKVNLDSNEYTILTSGLDHEAFKTMVPLSLERGTPPELFSYWAGERVQRLVDKNQLLAIDDLWDEENLTAGFGPAVVESAVIYNGKKYLLPITQHIVVFFYNKQLFTDLDITPPNSWAQFLSVCEQLLQQGIPPIALGARERWPAQFWFDYLLLRTAGPDFRTRLLNEKEPFTAQPVKTVYRMWSELIQAGYFNQDVDAADWAEATRLVKEGKAAMTLMGTWATQVFDEGSAPLVPGRDYDFFSFPRIEENVPNVALGPIDGIVISRESDNHEFAKKVLAYFASPDAQEIMSAGSGALAPSTAVPDSFYSPFKLRLKQEILRADQWAFAFDLSTRNEVAERGLDSFTELIAFPSQYLHILDDVQNQINSSH